MAPFLFLAPALVAFVVMSAYPVVSGLALSFTEWNGINPRIDFVGLDNYAALLGRDPLVTPLLARALRNTVVITLTVPPAVIVISFFLANAVESASRRLGSALRIVYFIPYITAGIAVFYAWRFLYLPKGGINAALRQLGLGAWAQPDGFLSQPSTALPAIIVVMIWLLVPFGMLIYLTGLQTLDRELLAAAAVDGANYAQTLRMVVWPLMAPATVLILVVCLRETLQDFQIILLMTNGGPLDSTTTVSFLAYQFAWSNNPRYGYASALGWMLFAAGIIISILAFRLAGRSTRTSTSTRKLKA